MSYAIRMKGEGISCKVPMSELPKLKKDFVKIIIKGDHASFIYDWEEDSTDIEGKIVGTDIVLNPQQYGRFKNSSDGGLEILLTRFKGSGIVSLTGEDGDKNDYKYTDGNKKKGKVVFDD